MPSSIFHQSELVIYKEKDIHCHVSNFAWECQMLAYIQVAQLQEFSDGK